MQWVPRALPVRLARKVQQVPKVLRVTTVPTALMGLMEPPDLKVRQVLLARRVRPAQQVLTDLMGQRVPPVRRVRRVLMVPMVQMVPQDLRVPPVPPDPKALRGRKDQRPPSPTR